MLSPTRLAGSTENYRKWASSSFQSSRAVGEECRNLGFLTPDSKNQCVDHLQSHLALPHFEA